MIILAKWKFAAVLILACLSLSAQPPKWNLALAANGADNAVISAGWPVVLRATVDWTIDAPGFDMFDPAQTVLEVFSSTGARVNWQVTAVGPRQKTRIDSANDLLTLTWGIAPQQTAAPGAYLVRLSAGTSRAAVRIRVNPASPKPDAATDSARRFTFAIYELTTGDAAGSLTLMREELKAHPDNVSAMSIAASALEKLNRKPEALDLLGAALEAISRQQSADGGSPEPPTNLQRRYNALIFELAVPAKAPR